MAAICFPVSSAEVPLARYSQPVAVVLVATMATPIARLTSCLLSRRQAPGPGVPTSGALALSEVSEDTTPVLLSTRLESS